MAGIKPTDFSEKNNLDGTEELYTQTNGINAKFTTEELKNYIIDDLPSGNNIVYSTGETFTGNYWFDGKEIYSTVLDFGDMTFNVAISKSFNFALIDSVIEVNLSGIGNTPPTPQIYLFNGITNFTINIELLKDTNEVIVMPFSDNVYGVTVTIFYTKM